MNEQRAGRRWKPLSLDLPPARMRYAAELRRHADASGQTLRDLSYRVGVSTATLSRAFNGDRILDDASLAALIQVFRLDTVQSQLLTFLADQARSGADTPVTAGAESATEGLADHLATLRQETGLTIREIAERLAATGTPVGKSSVERLLRDPGRSSVQALQVAGALISALPEERRGPALEGVFRAALHDAPGSTPPGTARLTVQMGGGKTAAMLQALRSDQAVPSEVTVAALARKLDLPVDELLALRRAATEPGSRRVPGRPVGEWSPFELEVHPAVVPARAEGTVLADLPAYVEREHDRLLSEAVQSAVQGDSRMVVLVGGSSTGKTRACWEAVQRLPEGWRLWHPYNPSRSEAVLEGIGRVEPRTVLWLNDAQHYLFDPSRGERVAAALRRLLSEPARGPVLVLGTLWPEYYAQLTSVPSPGAADVHAQARDLLTGRAVVVPDSFDGETLRRASSFAQADPRVAEALAMSGEHGGVTQFLAGAPELLRRYNDSSAAARALLDAAMDACRLGVSSPLPLSFLISAAEGYLSDSEWDLLPDDYAERAFAELARPVPGGLAPLRRIRSRTPGRPDRSLGSATALAPTTGPVFQLADYLQQYGQATRQLLCPPASFWHAATTQLTGSADLYNLANAAYDRYRIQWAHRLLRRAAEVADGQDLSRLARALETAGDRESAER
ncbi:helix-turn-helix domain-containing protein, partial [Streptomyces sp. NPDC050523]|uniref:helix-turn-helix domain-containing protein n=1 Tax=Streptomyces sp. NPDC050523 TaxID=3365622 RepID=UPI0037B67440